MNLVSKITIKSCGGISSIKSKEFDTIDENGKPTKRSIVTEAPLVRIAGIATPVYEVKSGEYGDSVAFKGEFTAVNIETGEQYASKTLFLPTIAESYLLGIVDTLADGESVELGFDIGVKPTSKGKGYEFTVLPLIEQKAESASQRLLRELTEKKPLPTLALLAPETPKEKTSKG